MGNVSFYLKKIVPTRVELVKPWAYPLVLGVMGSLIIVMLFIFKRKKWI